ncbi:CaCA family calcium/proton antiporter [Nitzschia inconspicua]|uniref:CaCA family calcium/proton antiporter n=1 Tax=Nitzschia inconspicua TaxID=303405 RepID=A0A9K3KP11_9STRA|nr:CaCA family calcium/proton antiporter [Nitzschia inconspicua]
MPKTSGHIHNNNNNNNNNARLPHRVVVELGMPAKKRLSFAHPLTTTTTRTRTKNKTLTTTTGTLTTSSTTTTTDIQRNTNDNNNIITPSSPEREKKEHSHRSCGCSRYYCIGPSCFTRNQEEQSSHCVDESEIKPLMMMEDSDHHSSSSRPPPSIPHLNGGSGSSSNHHHHRQQQQYHHQMSSASSFSGICGWLSGLSRELVSSSELLFNNKLNWLLILGPFALLGDATGMLGEAVCFAFSGIALIPCAERLSFVTEQVAEHTNGTIGALLNATFGNAPELLIATAALRSGFYRVVQLAMLGSMLTNLLFVFGISCLVGGLRWQVQELRITSGNVSVGMLLLSTAGSLLPATLVLGGQLIQSEKGAISTTGNAANAMMVPPSKEELQISRVNAFVMIFMYGCYLIFQLGTHKEEFDEEENIVQTASDRSLHLSPHFTSLHGRQSKARRNVFCAGAMRRANALRSCRLLRGGNSSNTNQRVQGEGWVAAPGLMTSGSGGDVEMATKHSDDQDDIFGLIPRNDSDDDSDDDDDDDSDVDSSSEEGNVLLPQNEALRNDSGSANDYFSEYAQEIPSSERDDSSTRHRRLGSSGASNHQGGSLGEVMSHSSVSRGVLKNKKKKSKKKEKNNTFRPMLPLGLAEPNDVPRNPPHVPRTATGAEEIHRPHQQPQMSFRAGIVWLFVITLGISAMSDILVDTIDGFAQRLHISEVFTSMIIVPFFSNVAEQVSAVLFAYRNEMDLCVGVTVGSAIQVASFVLPGCVIIGWLVDRSMTLYFHAYETVCLFLAVVVIAAVLQGGTTNWLVGATCISVYIMIATGFWFHSLEDLSVDAESYGQNSTRR